MEPMDTAPVAAVLSELGAAWWQLDLRTGIVATSVGCGRVFGFDDDAEVTAAHLASARPIPAALWRTLQAIYPGPVGTMRSWMVATRDDDGVLTQVTGLEVPERGGQGGGSAADRAVMADPLLLEDILAIQPAMVCRFLPDGTLVWCNEAYAAHVAVTPEEAIGKRWVDLVERMGYDSLEHLVELRDAIIRATPFGHTSTMLAPMAETNAMRWILWTNRRLPWAGSDGRDDGFVVQAVGIEVTELREARDALGMVARDLARVRVSERRELARRLHDDIVQVLISAKWELAPADDGSGVDHAAATRAAELVGLAVDQLRSCLGDLTSPAVLPRRLTEAVGHEAEALRSRGVLVDLDVVEPLDEETRTVCTRVLVEAMRNAGQHAHADRVRVSLRTTGGQVVGSIDDNGVGVTDDDLTRALATGHVGLVMARAFVESVNGSFNVEGKGRSTGTTLTFHIPLRGGADTP